MRNITPYPQTLRKKTLVVSAVVATHVSKPPMWTGMMEASGEAQGLQMPKLSVKQRQYKLADSTWSLLAEYHNVFTLEPSKLGCTHATKHVIKVTNNTLIKEWFRQIPPPLVEEVCAHLQEMLDSHVICPSQSAWCNAVVLVWKKDGGLHFCINVCHLNTCTKKDSYPLPKIQEAL